MEFLFGKINSREPPWAGYVCNYLVIYGDGSDEREREKKPILNKYRHEKVFAYARYVGYDTQYVHVRTRLPVPSMYVHCFALHVIILQRPYIIITNLRSSVIIYPARTKRKKDDLVRF